ncbi:MAG: hypothetical protein IAF02_29225 [Anaerolineae bacterium]|nr:hypothetical protein [Anaerolineae bacterium]
MRWLLLIGLMVLGLAGCKMVSEQPEFEVVVRKDGDEVETAVADNIAIFDIYSQIGIGDATVALTSGEWPDTILFRVYLSGLEEFKFAYGETEVKVAVSSSGENQVLESVTKNGEAQPISEDSPYYMPIRIESDNGELGIPLEDGYFEIEAPADFLAGEYGSFAISWVDFYR